MTNATTEIENLKARNARLKSFTARLEETPASELPALLTDPEIGELLGEYAPPMSAALARAGRLAAVMIEARRQEDEIVGHVNRQLGLPN